MPVAHLYNTVTNSSKFKMSLFIIPHECNIVNEILQKMKYYKSS